MAVARATNRDQRTRRRTDVRRFSSEPGGNDAEVETEHQQREQRDRKRDAPGQRFCRARRSAFILDQEIERRTEAGKDEEDEQHDDDFHERVRLQTV